MTRRKKVILPVHLVTVGNFSIQLVKVFIQLILNIFLLILDIIDWCINGIFFIGKFLINFLGPVSNAVYGKLNVAELYRVCALATSTGTGATGFFHIMHDNMNKFITDEYTLNLMNALIDGFLKNYCAVWLALIIFVGDVIRRIYQEHPNSVVVKGE